MRVKGFYRIPKKRTTCLVVYNGLTFSNAKQFYQHLIKELDYSPDMATRIIDTMPELTAEDATTILKKKHKCTKAEIEELMTTGKLTKKK